MVMKSSAPRFIASTAVSIEPKAVMTMTGRAGSTDRAASRTARPSAPGRRQSVRTRSTFSPERSFSIAAEPLATPTTLHPSAESISSSIERRESLSSTTRMEAMCKSVRNGKRKTKEGSRLPFLVFRFPSYCGVFVGCRSGVYSGR